jgi:hypothetical protein
VHHQFKKHDKVKLKFSPLVEDVEYSIESLEDETEPEIKKGMEGEINLLLPNGQYHVRIKDKSGKTIAYVAMDEDSLDKI